MSIVLNKSEIKDLIKRSDEYTVGALISICPSSETDMNFESVGDSKILNEVADFYLKKGYLTQKQIQMIRPKLLKYMNDVYKRGVEPAKINNHWKMPKRQKTKDAEKLDDNTIKVKFPYDKDIIKEIKKINNRTFIAEDKSWTVPLTVINIEKLIELGFSLDKELQKFYKERTQEITEAEVKGLDEILKPFQKKAVSFIDAKDGRALIADECGLGKTLESIAWIQHKKDAALPVVVVCPAAVKYNWKNEFIKFTDYTENDIEILNGREPYDPSCEIIIINYDILYDWRKKIVSKIKPKLLIGDEIHKIKTKSAKRSKAFAYIGKYTKYVIGLTGTPILNRPIEIYHPVSIIKPTVFPNEKQFKFRYCNPRNNGFGMTFNGASHTIELNQILTKEILLRRKKEDVLKELPDKQRVIMPLEIDNRKDYSWAYDDLINYLRNIDKEKAKKAERAKTLVKINTLKQLAVKGKISQATLWIEDFLENDKLVVFTYYRNTAEELSKKFSKNSVKIVGGMTDKQREKAEKKFWNDENTKLLIGNIEAAGTGMNFQISSNIAFLEYPWSPGLFRQCEDRVYRIGQKNAVTIWNLIAQSTIEANIVHKLEEKAKVISEVIDGDETEGGGIFNELIDQIYQEI